MIPIGRKRLSRRHLLRGVLGGALVGMGLPLLDAMKPARACGGVIPVRFGLFFWGNGNRPERWTPAEEGSEYTLTEELAPLEAVRAKINVLTGFSVKVPNTVPHGSGAAGLLSGAALITDSSAETYAAPTIDQVIAGEIGASTLYRSLQTAGTDCSGNSWNGPNSRNPPETSPWAFYDRIFGASFRQPGETGTVDPTLALRQSVLDSVLADANSLRPQLGAADQQRLDQHLEGVYELEARLQKLQEDPPALEACVKPSEPLGSYPDVEGRPQMEERNRVMAQIVAMALACDQSRVFAHYLTDPVSDVLFAGASAGHHDLTHNESGEQPEVHAITVQCMERFAELVQALDAIPEEDGTLLDNCAILACSEVSEGRTHSIDEIPLITAGAACGRLKTGLHVRTYGRESASKVMLTLMRAVDIPAADFGTDDAWTDDTVTEIEA